MPSWRKFEERVAKDFGGKLQPGSGRFHGSREDVITPNFLIQCKSSKDSTIRIEFDDINNLIGHAIQVQRTPILAAAPGWPHKSSYYFLITRSDIANGVLPISTAALKYRRLKTNQKGFSVNYIEDNQIHMDWEEDPHLPPGWVDSDLWKEIAIVPSRSLRRPDGKCF